MTSDKRHGQSAAQILASIDNMASLQRHDVLDLQDTMAEAMEAFDTVPCETPADALAFISVSRRLTQAILQDILHSGATDPACVEAADRYMETATAFLRGEDMRREHGHFGGFTRH